MAAFDDPAQGQLRALSSERDPRSGAFPQFTDFGYAAIGAPRNAAIPRQRGSRLSTTSGCAGRCEPISPTKHEYCGLFRTPSLRNVALRRVFLHNGVFHRLEDVVRFYAERDTAPAEVVPARPADGVIGIRRLARAVSGQCR